MLVFARALRRRVLEVMADSRHNPASELMGNTGVILDNGGSRPLGVLSGAGAVPAAHLP